MYRKRMGVTSIVETIFVILVSGILSVGALHLNNVLYVARAKNVIDYIEKQDSMWREIKDMGYGPISGRPNVASLRYNRYCQEVSHGDPTAVVVFNTYNDAGRWIYPIWENYVFNCLYVILGILPREIGIRIERSLDALTVDETFQNFSNLRGFRKKNIWIGESEFSPNGVSGFEIYSHAFKSNMGLGSDKDDVLDAYFLDHKMANTRQTMIIGSYMYGSTEVVKTCNASCKARTNISGKLIHFIEIKGKDSLVSRRYAHCSINDKGCAMPKSAFTGLTVNTGIGPIENMTGSSCGNRKSAKNECILVTRRMQEFAPWEDWNTIDNRPPPPPW